ncbi:MAG: glycosyltransferase family 2 protein [Nitrospina sp.]|jgi:glycosyltransferase involved in cell wall biosynthesis|nr:glycosyltransferase family 2 protein [Nitrospina sp.]
MINQHYFRIGVECDITFFVPCFNEENNIVFSLENIIRASIETGVSYEILLVDDNSQDNTVSVIENYMRTHSDIPITFVKNKKNRGLGRNYVEGAYISKGKYYMLVNGDNAEPLEAIVAIVQKLNLADMIVPYFGKKDARSLGRRKVSSTFTFLVNLFSGHSLKYYNGPVAHLKLNVMRWHADTDGFGYQAEILSRLLMEGASFIEVEISNIDRESGVTKAFSTKNFLAVSHSLFQIFLRRVRSYLFYSGKNS